MKKEKSHVVTLRDSIIVELLFIIVSLFVIVFIRQQNIFNFITAGISVGKQVAYGLLIGIGISLILFIVYRIKKSIISLNHLRVLTRSSDLSLLIAGILAGIGEEILFRGVIQYYTGIWIASIIFMLAHAQFWAKPPIEWGKMIYAVFAFSCGLLLGCLYLTAGLLCVITVHALIDSIAFIHLKRLFKDGSSEKQ